MSHSLQSGLTSRLASALICAGILAACAASADAQTASGAVVAPLVTSKQGKQIAQTALQSDESAWNAQDCSHLVHQIYAAAGYGYPYANSFDLYAGHGSFRRVKHAQPGDLIAWRGHVGIIVSPKAHTFYSLVRSGLQTEDYLSPYWRSRGTPRFYRYVLDSRAAIVSAMQVSSRGASVKSGISTMAEAEKTSQHTTRDAPVDEDESLGNAANESNAEPSVASVDIRTERERPNTAEVLAAVTSLAENTPSAFRTDQPLRAATPIVIFDDIKVEKLELKRDKGWAHLRISSHVQISADGAEFKRREEKVKWELRRGQSGWSAIPPQEYRLVSSDAAVRTLAARLADMTQNDRSSQHDQARVGDEARIANILAALLAQ